MLKPTVMLSLVCEDRKWNEMEGMENKEMVQ
jgi:hypothetical protein